ncbi:DUF2231 domain-containing protein [Deinococcus ruber]|uniref:DUF2231 domain-containing protein n=1 Tax=Deinococcus ruber TaxID=1848197 RepID=A0A918F922_9DEIO|nr:DUF2231 domain-containing protein [Deinococcus ruber]GGR20726.1 hypothetical protein GCM10008957_36380 [Deinococcus ruber]
MDNAINDRLEDALSQHDALEDLADQLQPLLRTALERLPAPLLSAMHGEMIGHPLHPILIHLPLGGWLIAGILDFVPLPGAEDTAHAADLALLLGTVGAGAAVGTGWADWSNTRGEARRTGLIHGLLNETAFILNGASLVCRARGKRRLGKFLSGSGLLLAAAGGFLGGQLVYRHGLGVGQTLARRQG